jgi:hypothetical protein
VRGRGRRERKGKHQGRPPGLGRKLARKVQPVARRHQMRLLDALEPAERSALYTSLHKLLAAAAPERPEEKEA